MSTLDLDKDPPPQHNVLGGELQACSYSPLTGYFRDGCCHSDGRDAGRHVVCARMTDDFLRYSFSLGNDLITPRPEYRFYGLKPGDSWCLCANRWLEAALAGHAPPVVLESTHVSALQVIDLATLERHKVHDTPKV